MKKLFAMLGVLVVLSTSPVIAQSSPRKYLSASGTNATLVRNGRTLVTSIVAANTTGTVYFLKLYDASTAPTCGSGTPTWTVPIPANSNVVIATNVAHYVGLGFCIVGGIADNDTSAAAAGAVINFGLTGF